MNQQATPAYEPVSDDDARLHLAQIIGSDLDTTVWTGDWHQTLRDTAAAWTTDLAA
ncbi:MULTISPECIES: hypothetical protein [unclassified Streptomyces]|uniref:hypothetical protein n=1 Tax=Streptomyces TaxID=1883 RepID=UPI00081B124B|nr:hypothetical protein [Streptomyces sp. BvitLS-983]MYX88456.1 hypothetical protein [Streptomyces sp. SID4915]SCE16933.1 hypothetical protein GA0115250_144787 [Streptomyces sp. BvitLS-983]